MTTPNPDVDAVIFDFAGVLSTSPGEMMRRQIDESGIDIEVDIASFIQIIMGPLDAEGDHPWHRLERDGSTSTSTSPASNRCGGRPGSRRSRHLRGAKPS